MFADCRDSSIPGRLSDSSGRRLLGLAGGAMMLVRMLASDAMISDACDHYDNTDESSNTW